jgi:hypothetical protein
VSPPRARRTFGQLTNEQQLLNVLVRLMIYRDEIGDATRLIYDRPSTLMSCLGNPDLDTDARRLDEKLAALAESVTGYGI